MLENRCSSADNYLRYVVICFFVAAFLDVIFYSQTYIFRIFLNIFFVCVPLSILIFMRLRALERKIWLSVLGLFPVIGFLFAVFLYFEELKEDN